MEARTLLSATLSTDLIVHADTSSADIQGFTPAQIRTAYGFDQVTDDGTGQTIAIVDAYNDPNIANDLAVFDSQFDLPTATLKVVNQTGARACRRRMPVGRVKFRSTWSGLTPWRPARKFCWSKLPATIPMT